MHAIMIMIEMLARHSGRSLWRSRRSMLARTDAPDWRRLLKGRGHHDLQDGATHEGRAARGRFEYRSDLTVELHQ